MILQFESQVSAHAQSKTLQETPTSAALPSGWTALIDRQLPNTIPAAGEWCKEGKGLNANEP